MERPAVLQRIVLLAQGSRVPGFGPDLGFPCARFARSFTPFLDEGSAQNVPEGGLGSLNLTQGMNKCESMMDRCPIQDVFRPQTRCSWVRLGIRGHSDPLSDDG